MVQVGEVRAGDARDVDMKARGEPAGGLGWTEADAEKARTGYGRVHEGLAPLLRDGVDITDARVQELVGLHYEVTSLFWTPTREAYAGLGRMYVDDERFRQNIGGGDDALVEYLRDAITVYAERNLA